MCQWSINRLTLSLNHLKVGLFNPGSLNTGHDEFTVAFLELAPDILAINETWLRDGEGDKAPIVPGYRFIHMPRPRSIKDGRGGGVGFYIRKGINARICPHPVVPSVEQMWLRLTIVGRTVIVGTSYRAPWQDAVSHFDALTDSIASFPKCDYLVLVGDFNIDLLDPNNSKRSLLQQFLQCLDLKQIISEPTHFYDDYTQTLIDIVCTNTPARKVVIKHTPDLGRHAMLVVEFNIKKDKPSPRIVTYRPIKNIIMDLFSRDVDSICWDYFHTSLDLNGQVLALNTIITTLFDLHAPLKTSRFKGPPHPWITETVKTMMRIRDDYHRRYKLNKCDTLKDCYKTMKHIVVAAVESEKTAFFSQHINKNIHNPKKLWKNLKNNILTNEHNGGELPPQFNDPDLINSHFLNVPGSGLVRISQLTYFEHHRYSSDSVSFSLQPESDFTIYKILQSFKSNAQGMDGISLDMVLMTLPQSLSAITAIINNSIVHGIFPESWKLAVIKPIPKNSQPSTLSDLRPISLLPCLSKLLEKVVCLQVTKYLEDHHILPQLQSGFRRGHSTSSALLDVVDNLLAAQDQGMCSILVLLDFSRAFDSISIPLLLSKLAFYGFDSNSLNWFSSYLDQRKQCVELRLPNGHTLKSSLQAVPRGVPQGSILGPILFILYSADIVQAITNSKFHLYADDVQLYHSFQPHDISDTVKRINGDLARVLQWSESNSLVLNPRKSKYMLLGTKARLEKLVNVPLNIQVGGVDVECVSEARSLGLILDKHLRFESHVAECVRNCFYRLRSLYRIRPYLSEEVRITLCESLILSKLNYCDVVYGSCLLVKTEKLIQRVQNACARFCFRIPPRTHVTPYLNSSNLLKMKARAKLHLAALLFGLINTKVPSYLYQKLKWVQDYSRYAKRDCTHVFVTPRHKLVAFRGSFRFAASRCWNDLPPPIRASKTLHTFRIRVKKLLLSSQIVL